MSFKSLTLFLKGERILSTEKDETRLFKELYQSHHRQVRKTLFWLVGDEWVDDLVQETFFKVWRNRHRFRGEASVNTWIYRIAVNTARSHFRKVKARPPSHDQTTETLQSEEPTSDPILAKLIEEAVLSLPEKRRIVFVLYYKQELSIEEISTAIDRPKGTVKSRLHKARDDFKYYLKKRGVTYEK